MQGFDPDKYIAKKQSPPTSGFDPDAYLAKKATPSEGPGALEQVGNALDYLGRTARTAIAAPLSDEISLQDVVDQASSFRKPAKPAPSGRDLLDLSGAGGISDKPLSEYVPSLFSESGEGLPLQKGGLFDWSPKGVAGFGVEVATDPTNLIPVGAVAKGVGKGAADVGKAALRGTGQAVKAVGKGAVKGAGAVLGGAADLATGTVKAMDPSAGKALEAGVEAFKQKGSQLISKVKPKIADDFADIKQLGKEFGIPEEILEANDALKYGNESYLGRQYQHQAQLPVGEQLRNQHNAGLDAIREASDRVIEKIAGGKPPQNALEAGELLQGAFVDKVKNTMDQMDFTYKTSASQMPNGGRFGYSPRANEKLKKELILVAQEAKRRANNIADPAIQAEGAQTMATVNNLLKAMDTKKSYGQMLEAMQGIGEAAFPKGPRPAVLGSAPPNQQALKDIYFAMSEAATTTVGDFIGKGPQKQLIQNNKTMSELFKGKDALGKLINTEGASPEKIFNQLVMSGDSAKLDAVVNFFGPDSPTVKQMRGAFLENLKRLGKGDKTSLPSLMTKLRTDKKMSVAAKKLFKPGEIDEFGKVLTLGERFGDYILNPSGTGVFLESGDPLKQLFKSAQTDAITDFMKSRVAGEPGQVPIQNIINSNKAVPRVESAFTGAKVAGDVASKAARPKSDYLGQIAKELPIKGAVRTVTGERQENRTSREKLLEQYATIKNKKVVSPDKAKEMWANQK